MTQVFDVDYDQILVEATDLSWVKCSFPRSKNSSKFVNLFMGMMHYFFNAKCVLKHHTKLSINSEQKVQCYRQFSFKIIFN